MDSEEPMPQRDKSKELTLPTKLDRDAKEGEATPPPEEMPEGMFHPDQVTQAENQKMVEEEGYPAVPTVPPAEEPPPEPPVSRTGTGKENVKKEPV
jgi:hypothetical protein